VAAHGLTKAALFMGAGVLLNRFSTIDEHELRGRGRAVWPIGAVFAVGGLVLAAVPMAGTFFGKSHMEDAASKLGYGWVAAVFVIASVLTGGAVLRVFGRVFLGLGPVEPPDAQAVEAEEEEPEAEQPPDHTPAIMVVPALALMAFAVVIALIPGFVHAVEIAADRFVDRPAYAASVLRGAHPALGHVAHHGLKPLDFALGGISAAGAVALAAAALAPDRVRRVAPAGAWAGLTRAVVGLRELHSGRVTDYVAWLTVGLAGVGGMFLLALR
jgi:multicomponent Na+:H+ antiporter subunit D